jgi:alkylhydroperoxidase family enzyme
MPRLRQVPLAEATPEIQQTYERLFPGRDPVAEPGTATGTPGNWWTVFALVPDVIQHAQAGFGVIGSRRRQMTPLQRELGLTRAGWATGSQFVFSQHCKGARAVGIPAEKVDAIPSWASSALFTPEERAVLAYADCLILADGRTPDGVFAKLREYMSEEAILELTYAICTYKLHATMCKALRLEYDDVDERIVEIAAPSGSSEDIMNTISRPGSN